MNHLFATPAWEDGIYLHDIQTNSMAYKNEHADAARVFYVSAILERAARARFHGAELTIWTCQEEHSNDLSIEPIGEDYCRSVDASALALPDSPPGTPWRPHSHLDAFEPAVCSLGLQLYCTDGSDITSPCSLELLNGALPPNSRILHRKTVMLDEGDNQHGRILLGHFLLSRALYRGFTETIRPSPDVPGETFVAPCVINHISARVLMPDPQRLGMPVMAPELLERIFSSAIQRTCDWPGCRIHASMSLWLLAQVSSQWHAVAKRLHRSHESISKKLIETTSVFEWHDRPTMPAQLINKVTDERRLFSISTIPEGGQAKQYQGVDLTVTIYGSEVPLPEITLDYLGCDPQADVEDLPLATQVESDVICYPVNLRFDTWGPGEDITAYQISGEATWSSRVVYTRRILFSKGSSPYHLGWFLASKPLCIDRDPALAPYHFGIRLSIPNPKRKRSRKLPPKVLERIFQEAFTADDMSMFGFAPMSQALMPSWSWSQDLRRFAGVCTDWADIAKKLYRFEVLLGQVTGYTHASCYSFGETVPAPNHIFAVTAVFDGDTSSRFEGASLTVCVPEEGVWSDVEVRYLGDTYKDGQVIQTPQAQNQAANDASSVVETETPVCPLALCLCTSADDGDSYHVSVKDFPQTRALHYRSLVFPKKGSKTIFFGYYHSSRAFTGSATSAIPIHVVRVSLPNPKRRRFPTLPPHIVEKIAVGVTELSDSKTRTEAWSENLCLMSLVNRQFNKAAGDRLKLVQELVAKEDPLDILDRSPTISEPLASPGHNSEDSDDTFSSATSLFFHAEVSPGLEF